MLKKGLPILLVLVMILTAFPLTVFANDLTTGYCGENVAYSFDSETGTLTLSGEGEMYDYLYDNVSPFYNNPDIKSIIIGNDITSIGQGAFSWCTSLTSIEIPSNVTNIGNRILEGCTGLTAIKVSAGNSVYDSRDNCNAIIETSSNRLIAGCKSTVIPDSVTSIGVFAFFDCKSLTSINIPKNVESIDDDAFYGCQGITSITVSEENSVYDSRENCNAIIDTLSNELIIGCESSVIPDSVTSIGYAAFSELATLTGISIPDSVTSIDDYAFNGCTGLKSVTIGNGLASIGDGAFWECTNLSDVYYSGSKDAWGDIDIGLDNDCLKNADIHCTDGIITLDPIESIEFEFATPVILYEKQGGYYDIDVNGTEYRLYEDETGYYYETWNRDTDTYEQTYVDVNSDNVFFFYSSMPLYKEGNKLTVHYKDGTSEVLTHHFFFDEDHQGFYLTDSNGEITQTGLRFNWTITVDSQFTPGSDNYITVTYLNKEVQVPVTVVEENDVERIEYTPVSPITFNVDDKKDCRVGYFDEEDRIFDTSHKICATGSKLNVYFKNGTSKEYTFYIKPLERDYFEPVIGYTYYLVDETGSQINYGLFSWTSNSYKWEPDNTYEITMSYLGVTTTVPVTVTSNWVKKDGKTYYCINGETVKSKLMTIDGKKYYFGSDGAMYTKRLISVSGKKYYMGADGAAVTSKLISVNGKKYYMGKDGVAYKSKLISVSGKKYYIGKDCVAYKSKFASLSGKKYYFGSDCAMVKSKLISVNGKKYYMGKDGVMYTSKLISVSGKKYYMGKDGIAYKSRFASLSGKKYYFGSDCAMYKSKTFSVSGVKWKADSKGVCKKV